MCRLDSPGTLWKNSTYALPRRVSMYTIEAPPERWGAVLPAAKSYAPTRPNGKRVPGWEDVNITSLAADMGVSFRYLLGVLSGQRNCTLALLQRAALMLGMELPILVARMEKAHQMRITAAASTPDKVERRWVRNDRRATQPQ